MNYDNMTADQLKKLSECQSANEAMAYIREEGIELTDEQLEDIAGGAKVWEAAWRGLKRAWEVITRKRPRSACDAQPDAAG